MKFASFVTIFFTNPALKTRHQPAKQGLNVTGLPCNKIPKLGSRAKLNFILIHFSVKVLRASDTEYRPSCSMKDLNVYPLFCLLI